MLSKEGIKVIAEDTMVLLQIAGVLMLLAVPIALYYKEYDMIGPVLIGSLISIIAGLPKKFLKTEAPTELRHGMAIVAIIWLLIPVVYALPFWLHLKGSYLNAYFEMMSAWTTTGFSMFNVELMPKTLLFLRSFAQWIGGLGIVVLALAGILKITTLYTAEARSERIKPSIVSTAKAMWLIYTAITVIGAGLFYYYGMGLFDSINHAMTGIATGGMATKNASFGFYNSVPIKIISILIMLAGAISLQVHYDISQGKIRKALSDVQLRYLLLFAFGGVLFLLFVNLGFVDIVFQSVSAITNTGFSTVDLSSVSDYTKFVLAALMVIGGSAGSTAGGIKVIRAVLVLKSVWWNVKRILLPTRAIITKKIDTYVFDEDEISSITTFVLLYFIFLFFTSLVLMALGYGTADSIFEAASAQGNTGLSVGIVSPALHAAGKIALIFSMWIGRLEIWTVLIFLGAMALRRY